MPERFLRLLACLPLAIRREIERASASSPRFFERLSEVRIRVGQRAALTLDGRSLLLPVVATQAELSAAFRALCAGSVYAHSESLREGYLTVEGYRIGIAGRAVTEGGEIIGMTDPTSFCIRVPHAVPGAGRVAEEVFRHLGARTGLLVYSPPGVGKTTLLRDLAISLSTGADALRVALIDTRGELFDEGTPVTAQIDVLRAYPIAAGISVATRTLAPQVIFCDEIGSYEEAESVLSVEGCGVPIIASAHAAHIRELLARPPVRILHEAGVFGAYVGIHRGAEGYRYTVDYREREDFVCSVSSAPPSLSG